MSHSKVVKSAYTRLHTYCRKKNVEIDLSIEEFVHLRSQTCNRCQKQLDETGVAINRINRKKPLTVDNALAVCASCNLLVKALSFNYKTYSQNLLRRGFRRSPLYLYAKQNAKRGYGKYECSSCKKLKGPKQIEVDHAVPVIDPKTGYIDLEQYAKRVYCEINNLQVLCKDCHDEKTNVEREIRVTKRRKK